MSNNVPSNMEDKTVNNRICCQWDKLVGFSHLNMFYQLTLFAVLVILVKCFGYSTQTHSKTSQTVLQNSIRDDWFSDAEEKVHELESKLLSLESRIPKTYPEVKFLNYVQRKRILVSTVYL